MQPRDSDSAPLFLFEGFALDHNANLLSTVFMDFRRPADRSPIGRLVKHGPSQYAIERTHTIQLTRPPYFRSKGETPINDPGEGLVRRRTVVQREMPIEIQKAWIQALGEFMEKVVELAGLEVISKSITMRNPTVTDTDDHTFTWGKDYWVYCTAMEPTSDAERTALAELLDQDYDHESFIPSPRTFAQQLARAYVEQYGAPFDADDPIEHKTGGVFVGNTYHRKQGVFHGPVIYVDDPFEVCSAALADKNTMIRTLLPVFVKDASLSAQREYRFVILDKAEHEADSKIMDVSPGLLAAVGPSHEPSGPMVVPDFHIPEAPQGE